MTPPDAPDAARSSGEPEKQPVATTTDDWSLGVLMQGRECKKCHATDVHGFDSPAFGKSWFCGTCGIVSLGGGYEPPKSAPVLVSPDVPEEPRRAHVHELKVWRMYFDALDSGQKSFEFRRDDREPRFEVGDTLHLREWLPWDPTEYITHPGEYTGRECVMRVTYVARGGPIIPKGFCIMSIKPISPPSRSGSASDPRFQTGDPVMDAALRLDDAKLAAMGVYDDEGQAGRASERAPDDNFAALIAHAEQRERELFAELTALRGETERLRAALATVQHEFVSAIFQYARHHTLCASVAKAGACDCGLDDVLPAALKALKSTSTSEETR